MAISLLRGSYVSDEYLQESHRTLQSPFCVGGCEYSSLYRIQYTKKLNFFSCGAKSPQPFTTKALLPSATETPQPRVVFKNAWQEAVRFHLKVHYGQLRRATIGRQKSSPFLAISLSLTVTELVEVHGLHSLFAYLRTINAKRNAKLHNNGIISVFHPDGQGISLKKLII